jgi:hypothetical protein
MWKLLMVLFVCMAGQAHAQALVLDSLWREVTYRGGLEQPGMMGTSVTSNVLGPFNESFSEVITSPGVAEAGAGVSQISSVDFQYGALFIQLTGDANNYATSVVEGGIADSFSWTELEVVFTATEDVLLTVDLTVSSSLGLFYDGPGAGVVETSHIGSILICVVGGPCLADILVDDLTDNGMAVADGVLDSVWLPPNQYAVQLLAVSQAITPDIGSASGSSAFSGEISVQPAPEPGLASGVGAGLALLAVFFVRQESAETKNVH